ncbi:MAG: ATP-dependent Clp protease adaptor ClpS [Bacteroidales bacterium]|nr:ATP-dependent Clp protease adaptor ClpS [Bacteroidales bacterium]
MKKEKTIPFNKNRELVEDIKKIVLYNDDFNTFDFVIDTLVEVCNHNVNQAEQCAFIVHYKGKCSVKRGSFNKLKPLKEEMLRRSLTVSIE